MNLEQLTDHLSVISEDRALCAAFRANNPKLIEAMKAILADAEQFVLRPCPPREEITAIQFTIFDNWKRNKRGYQYGVNVRAYVGEKVDLEKPKWGATAIMWPSADVPKEAKALQRSKVKHKIDDLTRADLNALATVFPNHYIGLLRHRHPQDGTFVYAGHYIVLEMDGSKAKQATMVAPSWNDDVCFTDFDTRDAKGNALRKTAVLQCRYSDHPRMQGWSKSHLPQR